MNVRLIYPAQFIAGVYFEGKLRMNSYLLKVYMITNTTNTVNHHIAFERLKHFIYSEIDSTIFINSEEIDKCRAMVSAGINITTLSSEPVDQLVGLMLHSKLNAIMDGKITIIESEISSTLGDNVIYLHDESEKTEIDRSPWWLTDDLTHCDDQFTDTDKILSLPVNVWRDLDLAWPTEPSPTPGDNTVVFADFKRDDN
jgi:hypothetical protein